MTTLKTITTIELSSKCNLACKYCINRLMKKNGRQPGIMSQEVFFKSLELLDDLCIAGTQQEVNVNGNGESMLDEDIYGRINLIREVVGGNRFVGFSTNGINLTLDKAMRLKETGINRLDISLHDTMAARRAVDYCRTVGLPCQVNPGAVVSPHNWANQIEEENRTAWVPSIPCDPLYQGRGYIQSHGGVSPCCYDYLGKGQFGTVFDDDILECEYGEYELCKSCHQTIIDKFADVSNKIVGKCVENQATTNGN